MVVGSPAPPPPPGGYGMVVGFPAPTLGGYGMVVEVDESCQKFTYAEMMKFQLKFIDFSIHHTRGGS